MAKDDIDTWVRLKYRSLYCNGTGKQVRPIDFSDFNSTLRSEQPSKANAIKEAIQILDNELFQVVIPEIDRNKLEERCGKYRINEKGYFSGIETIKKELATLFPSIHPRKLTGLVLSVEKKKRASAVTSKSKIATAPPATKDGPASAVQSPSKPLRSEPSLAQQTIKDTDSVQLEAWVREQYVGIGFTNPNFGFIGFKGFLKLLQQKRPSYAADIEATLTKLRRQGHVYSLQSTTEVQLKKIKDAKDREIAKKQNETKLIGNAVGCVDGGVQISLSSVPPTPSNLSQPQWRTPNKDSGLEMSQASAKSPIDVPPSHTTLSIIDQFPGLPLKPIISTPIPTTQVSLPGTPDDLLSRKLKQLYLGRDHKAEISRSSSMTSPCSEDMSDDGSITHLTEGVHGPDFSRVDQLLADKSIHRDSEDVLGGVESQIQHAPLISGEIIKTSAPNLLPQYGFLGSVVGGDPGHAESKMFLNTNVPFSTFICGVQGSGKSHSTSCILENALIPSPYLGRLENPVSALVFSYGDFNADGAGFNISEAAFLGSPHPSIANHPSVRKITVLTSPTNPQIKRLYARLPNVTVMEFKLRASTLDIKTIHLLMNIDEKAETPLYMAQVQKILRQMAIESDANGFDYMKFKEKLALCHFNPAQLNMLEMRLDLLESFLDLSGKYPEPEFRPGEVTIMDMSDPFMDANTACLMFKIGLQRYLQSKTPGKMVVLDEAHKYMLKVPGAKLLNDYLLTIIRLQRHFGARVVISTQEPTLLTDLIALCSVTIIHRFSSPEWLAAIKKHIPIYNDGMQDAVREIENLTTGTALVYSANAVLGKDEEDGLVKGSSGLLKLDIRKRVTYDGGQSVLCV